MIPDYMQEVGKEILLEKGRFKATVVDYLTYHQDSGANLTPLQCHQELCGVSFGVNVAYDHKGGQMTFSLDSPIGPWQDTQRFEIEKQWKPIIENWAAGPCYAFLSLAFDMVQTAQFQVNRDHVAIEVATGPAVRTVSSKSL